jgi:proton-dependent oligopeptide transporter, POT family
MAEQKKDRSGEAVKTNPLREIVQPFIDLVHAPRALWGVNVAYLLEGLVYFGMLGYLAMHFSDFIFRGVPDSDIHSHRMVMVLTAGITIAMFVLGFVADKYGVRRALITAFVFLLIGRVIISGAAVSLAPAGMWSPLHLTTMLGILCVVIGYGMYQPAAYAAVRQFTTPKTAGMAFAMLYALMNLGGFLPTFAFLLRDEKYLGLNISGTFCIYTALTALALVWTLAILTRKTVARAIAEAKSAHGADAKKDLDGHSRADGEAAPKTERTEPIARAPMSFADKVWDWIVNHPLMNAKFAFFIFALMPVQTLFTYNWFILPQYVSRTYQGWIGEYFEIASNFNPLLVFVLVPIIAAVTQKRKVYNMMIVGTFVMAAPAFLLVIGPSPWTLFGYIVLMTIGEAMWQPRFLQYAAEIAPEGRTGQYMGVAQLPWFMTKLLVPLLYSGRVLTHYCPKEGVKDTQTMWLIFACIAMCSCVMLLLGKRWVGKDFKTKAA